MTSQKGIALTFRTIIIALILLAVLGFALYMIAVYLVPKGIAIGKLGPAQDQLCLAKGRMLRERGIEFVDADGDERPDYYCDSCVPGNNDIDADADGVPDACDAGPKDPRVGFCFEAGKDCTGTKCCKADGPCANGKGTFRNIGTAKKPVWQCALK